MPRRVDSGLEQAIQRIVDRVDDRQPYARQLEQATLAALDFGLQHTARSRSRRRLVATGLRGRIDTAVAGFTAASHQEVLQAAVHQAGVPHLELLGGVVLKHCQEALRPLTTEQVARYGLEFALTLAEARPALARQYRRWLARRPSTIT